MVNYLRLVGSTALYLGVIGIFSFDSETFRNISRTVAFGGITLWGIERSVKTISNHKSLQDILADCGLAVGGAGFALSYVGKTIDEETLQLVGKGIGLAGVTSIAVGLASKVIDYFDNRFFKKTDEV